MAMTPDEAAELFRAPPDGYIEVGGAEVAHRKIGTGPDVLFVHGWPVSGATFRTLLPYLADHVTCHLIDLPGTGSSRYGPDTELGIGTHIDAVRAVMDALDAESIAVVGHDSGGMIARHAVVEHARLRAMGLINTEPSGGLGWRFKSFLAMRKVPGFARGLSWVAGKPKLRRNRAVLGDAFADRSHLDGEFAEFFLDPLHEDRSYLDATMKILASFDYRYVDELEAIHRRLDVPVHLVWGEKDPFFPIADARAMLPTFPNAELTVIEGASLFSHEEAAEEVAAALLPTLRDS